jgi:hypothetical protein
LYNLSNMTGIEFLSEAKEVIPVEYGRLVKQSTGLRALGLFPDGRTREPLTFQQIAHMVRVMVLDFNPFNEIFISRIEEYKSLYSESGENFIDAFAGILENHGLIQGKPGLIAVQRISFSLDRPFVSITFEDSLDAQDLEKMIKEKALHINYNHKNGVMTYRSELTYGPDMKARPFERFCVLKRSAIQKLSLAFSMCEMTNDV